MIIYLLTFIICLTLMLSALKIYFDELDLRPTEIETNIEEVSKGKYLITFQLPFCQENIKSRELHLCVDDQYSILELETNIDKYGSIFYDGQKIKILTYDINNKGQRFGPYDYTELR